MFATSFAAFYFIRFLRETRELNDFSKFQFFAGLRAQAIDSVPGDGQRVMQIIKMIAVKPQRLLRAPSKAVGPRCVFQRDNASAVMLLNENFNSLIFTL